MNRVSPMPEQQQQQQQQRDAPAGAAAGGALSMPMSMPPLHSETGAGPHPTAPSSLSQTQRIAENDEATGGSGLAASFAKKVANNTSVYYTVGLAGHVLAILLTVILVFSGYNILPLQLPTTLPVTSDPSLAARDSYYDSAQATPDNNMIKQRLVSMPERVISLFPTGVVYESGTNVLTKDNLFSIKELEDRLMSKEEFTTKLCQLTETSGTYACVKPDSVLRLFDGTYAYLGVNDTSGNNVFREDLLFTRIGEIISTAYDANGVSDSPLLEAAGQPTLRSKVETWLGKDYSQETVSSKWLRSYVFSGYPVEGYINTADDTAAQESYVSAQQVAVIAPYLDARTEVGFDVKVTYSSEAMQDAATRSERDMDHYLMAGSVAFCLLFLAVATESLWIAFNALFGAVGTLAWANLLYRIVTDFQFYGEPQILASYIVVAVVCTGTLLVHYKYKSGAESFSQTERIARALGESNAVMGLAILTSMLSFAVSCASQIVVVQGFSLFCFWGLFVCYLNFFVFLPSVILIADRGPGYNCERHSGRRCVASLERLLSESYVTKFVGHNAVRWIIIATTLTLVVVFLIFSVVRLNVERQPPMAFRENTNFNAYESAVATQFATGSTNAVAVNMVFGLENVDGAACHPSNAGCLPQLQYNFQFDFGADTLQSQFLQFCQDLESLSSDEISSLQIRRSSDLDPVTKLGPLQIQCFMQDMQEYYSTEQFTGQGPMPFTPEDMQAVMEGDADLWPANVYTAAPFFAPINSSATFYRNFEVGAVTWLANIYAKQPDVYSRGSKAFGGAADYTITRGPAPPSPSPSSSNSSDAIVSAGTRMGPMTFGGKSGDNVRFATIRVELQLNALDVSPDEARSAQDAWEAYATTHFGSSAQLPLGLQGAFLATPDRKTWQWLSAQSQLLVSIFAGIGASLAVVILAVSLGTGNIVLGLEAGFVAACVVVLDFGLLAFAEWSLGLIESLNAIFFVAVAAQPVVLLSAAYASAAEQEHETIGRLRAALATSGPAILMSSLLTMGAALFLLGSRLAYTFQFGVLLLATSGFSLFLTLVFFAAFLGVFGPEKTTGDLPTGIRRDSKASLIKKDVAEKAV